MTTSEITFPIIISDHGRVVHAEESLDGEGVVVEVREDGGTVSWYYAYDGGCWALCADGTLGRQIHGTCDAVLPRTTAAAARYLQAAYLSD